MENITDMHVIPITPDMESTLTTVRMNYEQDGIRKFWDMVWKDDNIQVIVFNTTRKCLVATKTFKAGTYNSFLPKNSLDKTIDLKKYPLSLGVTLTLCSEATKDKTDLEKKAKDMVLKKCGYDVQIDNLKRIHSYRAGISITSAITTIFYCLVKDSDKVQEFVAPAEGFFEVVEITIPELKTIVCKRTVLTCTTDFLFAIYWLLYNIEHSKIIDLDN